ncbi:MAG TPA: DUF938 domain-containing protein [Deltaproteobacteria bacterium]|nr:DUF938 domain-containing protein [Deltaproteobacteria bacterium]
MSKRDAPAARRNRKPILAVLERWLVEPARVLEIACGTGQHAVHFAEHLPHVTWQPTDREASSLESTRLWALEAGLPNLEAPKELDVLETRWPVEEADAIFNANMIHIAPWSVAEGLFRGAGRVLGSSGLLFLYGPFRVGGRHTSASNEAFDLDLRRRDERWGVRDLERVVEEAGRQGLGLVEENGMPANNKLLVFRRE